MDYNILFLSVYLYRGGEEDIKTYCPVAFDPRKIHTRKRIIKELENIARRHYFSNTAYEVENREFNFVKVPENVQRWMPEKLYEFNKDNIKIIETINKTSEDEEETFYYQILEVSPIHIKAQSSDLEILSNMKKSNSMRRVSAFETLSEQKSIIKDYLWATVYTTVPPYDFDDRYCIADTFRTVSKNLLGLLFEERNNFKEEARSFALSCYPDYENDEEDWFQKDFQCRTRIDWGKSFCEEKTVLSFLNYPGIFTVEDGNGFYFQSSIIKVPIIGSYLEGTGDETECGE